MTKVSEEELEQIWNIPKKNVSYEGPYAVQQGYPQNPLGRTGIFGCGHLPKFGPNFKSIPILTRFKDPDLAFKLDTPLEVLVHFPDLSQLNEFQLPELDSDPDEPLTKDFAALLFRSISNTNATVRSNLKRILRR